MKPDGNTAPLTSDEEECETCWGEEEIDCEVCDGSGEINGQSCDECTGTGQIECPEGC